MPKELLEAWRSWRRTPAQWLLDVGVLAVGLAGTAVLLTLVHGVLLRPLPYDSSELLHTVWFRAPGLDIERFEQSPGTFVHFAEAAEAFEHFGLYTDEELAVTGQGPARRLPASRITPSVLEALGVRALRGGILPRGADVPGAAPSVLISERLWRERGERSEAVGETLRVDGIEHEIVGVLPDAFAFPRPQTDLWLPLVVDRAAPAVTDFSYSGLALLAPGVSPSGAQAQLERLTATLANAYPEDLSPRFLEESGMQPFLEPLRDSVVGSAALMLWPALAATFAVLLIATANVFNLLLVRAEAHHTELSLRAALGASRSRLWARAACDGVLVGAPAGLAAGLLAVSALGVVRTQTALGLPRLHEISAGVETMVLTTACGIALGALLGLAAGVRRSGGLAAGLAPSGQRTTAGRDSWRARHAFVVLQVALSTALLLLSGLLVRSRAELASLDPGFEAERLATFFVALPESAYGDGESARSFWRTALEDLEAQPGVLTAAAASKLPFDPGGQTGTLIEDHPSDDGLSYVFGHRVVSTAYFSATGIPLLAGRTFDERDELVSPEAGVVVVSEELARRYWDDPRAALGRRLRPAGAQSDGTDLPWATIVGVVGNLRGVGLRELSSPTVYFPMSADQGRLLRSQYLVADLEPGASLGLDDARRVLAAVDVGVPLARWRSGAELVAEETRQLRMTAGLLGLAALLATALGAFGLFAVLLTMVSLRRREIGVRLALGASGANLSWLVTRTALVLAGGGAALGTLLALVGSRSLAALLYGVSALDVGNLVTVAALLCAATLAASLAPIVRALSVDPAVELRGD